MAWVAPVLGIASTALSAIGGARSGKAERRAREMEARQHEIDAKNIAGESQREAISLKRNANRLGSRARAVAAASGAGTDNITVENILGDIEAEGEYQKMAALYSGLTSSDKNNYAAGAARREGRAAQNVGYLNAATTVLGGGADWYGKYKDWAWV